MKIDIKIQSIIDNIQNGKLNEYLKQLDNSDFGLYVPAFEDQGTVKPMMEGYSQNEQDLAISIEKNNESNPDGGLIVGWLAAPKPSSGDGGDPSPYDNDVCHHGGKRSCHHCKSHGRGATRCNGHADKRSMSGIELAPELDYHAVVKQIDNKKELLNSLASYGLGLTLLHGHSEQFMFTTLPEGYVSVIADGVTTFRKEVDVAKDSTFVPSTWRSINAEIRVAGGHSQLVIN